MLNKEILESKLSDETIKEMLTSLGWSYSLLTDISGGYWYKNNLTANSIKDAWNKEICDEN